MSDDLQSWNGDLMAAPRLDAMAKLDKVRWGLEAAGAALQARDETNAALLLEPVRYSPVTKAVDDAVDAIEPIEAALGQPVPVIVTSDDRYRRVILTLPARAFQRLEAIAAETAIDAGRLAEAMLSAAIADASAPSLDTTGTATGHHGDGSDHD